MPVTHARRDERDLWVMVLANMGEKFWFVALCVCFASYIYGVLAYPMESTTTDFPFLFTCIHLYQNPFLVGHFDKGNLGKYGIICP